MDGSDGLPLHGNGGKIDAPPTGPVLVVLGEAALSPAAALFPQHTVASPPDGVDVATVRWDVLKGCTVLLWCVSADKRIKLIIGHLLMARVDSVRLVQPPSPPFPTGWNVGGDLPSGQTTDDLRKLLFSPTPVDDASAEVARLATLPVAEYERERKAAAHRLGYRLAVLDKLVKEARAAGIPIADENDADDAGDLKWFDGVLDRFTPDRKPEKPEPPVDGLPLIADIAAMVGKFMVMPAEFVDAVAMWVVHTWLYDAFHHTPRLLITSPTRGCGKTTLLNIVGALAARPKNLIHVTPAALYHAAVDQPTFLIDEADHYLARTPLLVTIVNGGFQRGGKVGRVIGGVYVEYPTWAPCAIAARLKPPEFVIPDTVISRSVHLTVQKRHPSERRPPEFRDDRPPKELADLRHRLRRWATQERLTTLAASDPTLPRKLGDRDRNLWRPLVAIAEMIGGGWFDRAHGAAEALTLAARQREDMDPTIALLTDIRAVYATKKRAFLGSQEIVDALVAMEGAPWADFRRGRALTTHAMARALKPHNIYSQLVKEPRSVGENIGKRGYFSENFRDEWRRYGVIR